MFNDDTYLFHPDLDHGDERELVDYFPIGSRVIVDHPHSAREIARGVVEGVTEGLYDTGGPESGPGPLEECELLLVRCDDGMTRRAYPGDVEPEHESD